MGLKVDNPGSWGGIYQFNTAIQTDSLIIDPGILKPTLNEPFLGNTALAVAAHNGHLDVVEELIQNGAYINETNKNGKLALFFFLLHEIIKRGCY